MTLLGIILVTWVIIVALQSAFLTKSGLEMEPMTLERFYVVMGRTPLFSDLLVKTDEVIAQPLMWVIGTVVVLGGVAAALGL